MVILVEEDKTWAAGGRARPGVIYKPRPRAVYKNPTRLSVRPIKEKGH